MREAVARAYQRFRDPATFLRVLLLFISCSMVLHFWWHYDADWGATNLALSIEASVASAALMLLARDSQRRAAEAAEWQRTHTEHQGHMLSAVLELAEAARDASVQSHLLLQRQGEHDEKLLGLVTRALDRS